MKRTRLGAWTISLLVAGSAALAISGSLAGPAGAAPARPAAASASVKTVGQTQTVSLPTSLPS
jgi:hypothetical protein